MTMGLGRTITTGAISPVMLIGLFAAVSPVRT